MEKKLIEVRIYHSHADKMTPGTDYAWSRAEIPWDATNPWAIEELHYRARVVVRRAVKHLLAGGDEVLIKDIPKRQRRRGGGA